MDEVTLYNLLARNNKADKDLDLRERYILLLQLLVEKKVIKKREMNKLIKGFIQKEVN